MFLVSPLVRARRSSSRHRLSLACPSGHRAPWSVVRRRLIRGGGRVACRTCRAIEAEPGWTWTLGISSWPAGDLLRAAFAGLVGHPKKGVRP
jgi:hypothetical protein